MTKIASVILAAGKGTRMQSDVPKVLHVLKGQPLLRHVIDLTNELGIDKKIMIVGYGRDQVLEYAEQFTVDFAVQEPQLGTGHAVMQAEAALKDFEGDVLVLYGDVPLLRAATIKNMLDLHAQLEASATILTAIFEDPTGYGRIIRNSQGDILGIVEQKDATEEQRHVKEINSGIIVFDSKDLFTALKSITNSNSQGEYYLTDVIDILVSNGKKVKGMVLPNPNEIAGVNSPEQLAEAERLLDENLV